MADIKLQIENLNLFYGKNQVIKELSFNIINHELFTVIGPANSGKSSLLNTLNRLNEVNPVFRRTGSVFLNGRDIFTGMDAEEVRTRIGIVFALPQVLPLSIRDNITYGPRMQGRKKKEELDRLVEQSLTEAYLWDEVRDRLSSEALNLSGGQQQRLCIARILALQSEVILFDEPTSGLDPLSTAKVEETMLLLKEKHTVVLVTNNVSQAARVGDRTAFFLMGELVELDRTEKIFTAPADQRTNDYITGKFG